MYKYVDNLLLAGRKRYYQNLFESGVAGLRKQFPKLSDELFNKALDCDPEHNGEKCGPAFRWILQQIYRNQNVDDAYFKKCKKLFNTLKTKTKSGMQKISQANNIDELEQLVKTLLADNKQLVRKKPIAFTLIAQSVKKGAKIVYEGKDYIVLIPWTPQASQVFHQDYPSKLKRDGGSYCTWCTGWHDSAQWCKYMGNIAPLHIVYDIQNDIMYQYSCSKDSWAGFRDMLNQKQDMNEVIKNPEVISLITEKGRKIWKEDAQETFNKFGKELTYSEKKVLEKYINVLDPIECKNKLDIDYEFPNVESEVLYHYLVEEEGEDIEPEDTENMVDYEWLVYTYSRAKDEAWNYIYEKIYEDGLLNVFDMDRISYSLDNDSLRDKMREDITDGFYSMSEKDFVYNMGYHDELFDKNIFNIKNIRKNSPAMKLLDIDSSIEKIIELYGEGKIKINDFIKEPDFDEIYDKAIENEMENYENPIDYYSEMYMDNDEGLVKFLKDNDFLDIDNLVDNYIDDLDSFEFLASYDNIERVYIYDNDEYFIYRVG